MRNTNRLTLCSTNQPEITNSETRLEEQTDGTLFLLALEIEHIYLFLMAPSKHTQPFYKKKRTHL
ncbi:hypothetical protein AMECASPLE_030215, partial [Ameca splendens]